MKNTAITEKDTLHPRNPHRFRYDFEKLTLSFPELQSFIYVNEHDLETIDFSNPDAVKSLNKSILIADYDIQNWDIPKDYLCPPIPGRADYVHYIADLLAASNSEIIPLGENIIGLDIGIGANCIYPIIGYEAYQWNFVGTDIDEKIPKEESKKILAENLYNILEGNYYTTERKFFVVDPAIIPPSGIYISYDKKIPEKQKLPKKYFIIQQGKDITSEIYQDYNNLVPLETVESQSYFTEISATEEDLKTSSKSDFLDEKDLISKFFKNPIGVLPYFPPNKD